MTSPTSASSVVSNMLDMISRKRPRVEKALRDNRVRCREQELAVRAQSVRKEIPDPDERTKRDERRQGRAP